MLHQKTCLGLHHPPKIESDAPNNVDLRHSVSTILILVCSKAVL